LVGDALATQYFSFDSFVFVPSASCIFIWFVLSSFSPSFFIFSSATFLLVLCALFVILYAGLICAYMVLLETFRVLVRDSVIRLILVFLFKGPLLTVRS
jgi:hypothetical protein